MNNHFHPSGAVAGPPGPGNQGFGVLGFGHLSHSVPGATSAGSGSVLTGAATVGSSMPAGALAGATGNITVMHPSSQVTAMPPPSSANSQHHAQQMHAQASHSQYLYQQQQHHQLLMNAAANGAWFLPTSNGLPQGMIGPMVSQAGAVAGAFGQDRSMAAAAAAAATQQQGTQALLSHLASLAPQQPAPSPQLAFTAANMASITQAQQQQHPNYMFMTQKWQQQLQQHQHQQHQQHQQQQLQQQQQQQPNQVSPQLMLQSAQHESDKNAGAAAALSLDPSLAMPPPKAAPAQLGQSSSSTSSAAQTGRLLEPHFSLPLSHADQKLSQQPLLTPPLARKEMNQPPTSRSTSSTTTSTPPPASAALTSGAYHAIGANVEAALKLAGNNAEPDLATPAADITSTPPRPESTVSTSPALSSTTKLPKAPSMPMKGGNSKDTKRKAGNASFKRDAAVSSSVTAVGTTLITKRKPGQLASVKKSRTTPAQPALHPPPQPLPLPIDTAPATPLVSSITLPLSATLPPQAMANQLASKKLPRASSVTNIAASETLGSAPRLPSQAASRDQMSSAASDLPPVPLQTAQTLDSMPPVILSQKEVLGRGIEQLLKFHSVFAPADDAPDLDYWTTAISDNFCDIGNIRLELGTQSYDMPAAAASGFYHRLFSEGAAVSMHIALGRPNLYRLKQNSSIMSFHGVHMTTTYANGRRVLEAGDLRVIFGDDFRIRLWAFSSEDATVCLPRKRPNGTDEALTRTCEATIGRNLDWPNNPPVPKRRKSANGKQPPEECALPACALQHLEIANTMYYLQELIDLQLQNKSSPLSIMDLWVMAAKPEPLVAKQLTRIPGPERKPRTRKKSSATALPIPPQLLPPPAPMTARPDDAEPSVSDSKAKSSVFTVSPAVPPLSSKPPRQQTKH